MSKRIALSLILCIFAIGVSSCCKGHCCWLNPTRADNCCSHEKHKGCCNEKVHDSNCVK